MAINFNRRLNLLTVFSLVGVILSVVLTQHYYQVRTGSAGFKSFCNIAQTMNCDVIAASPYSELVAGIPLSSFATGWFLALFAIALFARNSFWRREGLRAALGLTLFSTLMSVGYFLVMAGILKTYCLYCLGVDLIS